MNLDGYKLIGTHWIALRENSDDVAFLIVWKFSTKYIEVNNQLKKKVDRFYYLIFSKQF